MTILICSCCTLLIAIEQGNGLSSELANIKDNLVGNGITESQFHDTIEPFYNAYYDQVKMFASQYIYIMGGACIFALFSQFISLLVIAEGRQTIVVFASIFCNALNILLDFVLIKYGKLAMIGGAVATDIG
jgi:Na+-driven multidrug efflux pump